MHQVLLEACKAVPTIQLVPTTKVHGFEDNGDKVRLFTNSNPIEGAAIIAADGLRSVIRQQLLNEGQPRMVGYVAHRTIIPMDQLTADVRREESVLWSGPGFHLVHYPLRNFTLFNMVAVFKTSTYAERGDLADYRAEIDRTYREFPPGHEGATCHDGRRPALGDLRPRSDPALERRARGVTWRRGTPDFAVACPRRLHGDRGCRVSRRLD